LDEPIKRNAKKPPMARIGRIKRKLMYRFVQNLKFGAEFTIFFEVLN